MLRRNVVTGVSLLLAIALLFHLNLVLVSAEESSAVLSEEEFESEVTALAERVRAGQGDAAHLAKLLVTHAQDKPDLPQFLSALQVDTTEFRESLGTELETVTAALLPEKLSTEVVGLKKLAQLFLRSTDPHLSAVLRLFGLAERMEYFQESADVIGLLGIRERLRGPAETTIFETRVTDILHQYAERQLSLDQPGEALKAVAGVNELERDDNTYLLASKALIQLNERANQRALSVTDWPFDQSAKNLVTELVKREPEAKEVLVNLTAQAAQIFVEVGEPLYAEEAYDWLIELRDDVDENNKLRLELVLKAQSPEARGFAKRLVSELRVNDALSWWANLRILLSGFYGTKLILVFYICLSVALVAIILACLMPLFMGRSLWVERPAEEANVSTVLDEYTELLGKFGLDENASEDRIKQEYRKMVKDFHPDTAHAEGASAAEEASEKFVELKKAYERILEIKRSRFG